MLHHDSIPTSQPDLFDSGQHARATRATAAASALKKGPSRRDQIETFIRECGSHGATRHEIADHFHWPLSGVCQPVLDLLRDGVLVEDGQTRVTQYGSPAGVIVLAEVTI